MKYSIYCDCQRQDVFRKKLYHIISLNLMCPDTGEEIHNVAKETNDFINNWCPTLKDCPCKKEKEGG